MAKFKKGDIVKLVELDDYCDSWVELGMEFEVLDDSCVPLCKSLESGLTKAFDEYQLELVKEHSLIKKPNHYIGEQRIIEDYFGVKGEDK